MRVGDGWKMRLTEQFDKILREDFSNINWTYMTEPSGLR